MLVCSAGITGPNTVLRDYPVDAWQRVIDVNLNGLFYYCNRAAVPAMEAGGYGPHRQRRVDRRQGGQPQRLGLFGLQGRW